MRFFALTWPFTFGVRLGWATTRVRNPDIAQARGRVYLLRGNGILFSQGFGAMCDRLRSAGYWAEDLRCVGDRWVCKQLLQDQAAGRLRGPIIFVGHSCGGRHALYAAQQLQQRGIHVSQVICIDVALPGEVATSMTEAVHLYRSKRRVYPVRPLSMVPGSKTHVMNVDLDQAASPISPAWLNHLNITNSKAVQDWVVDRILQYVHPSE